MDYSEESNMHPRYITFVFLIIPVFILVSCGQYDFSGVSRESSGGITAKLVFPEQLSGPVDEGRVVPLADLSGEVETVVFTAMQNMVTAASASFAYTSHSGILSGIPVGGQYLIKVEGRSGLGVTQYQCSKSGVRINPDETTDLGLLYMIGSSAGIFTNSGQSLNDATYSIALGDLDNDGDLDLVQGEYNETNSIWKNNGVGFFSYFSETLASNATRSIAIGDVDSDGDLDLIEGNYGQSNLVWLNNGTGEFIDSGWSLGSYNTRSISLGDVDSDEDLDVIEGNYGQGNRIWLNNGSGVFTSSDTSYGSNDTTAIALGDVDGDGHLDLVEGNHYQGNLVWLNNGEGIFYDSGQLIGSPVFKDDNTNSITLGDVDGDGDLDMVEGNDWSGGTIGANYIWLNNGSGYFTYSGQGLGNNETTSILLNDVDGDLDLDIVTGNYGAFEPNNVWINQGYAQGGTIGLFVNSGQPAGNNNTLSIALGDLDNDGDLDLVDGAPNSESSRVWFNE